MFFLQYRNCCQRENREEITVKRFSLLSDEAQEFLRYRKTVCESEIRQLVRFFAFTGYQNNYQERIGSKKHLLVLIVKRLSH